MPISREAMYQRMVSSHNLYRIQIDQMIDYQIQRIDEALTIAKMIIFILFILSITTFFLYRLRLNQIYLDINQACYTDVEIAKVGIRTHEISLILKRLSHKTSITTNPSFVHHQSAITNEKGMLSTYSVKRSQKKSTSLFLIIFEIDQYPNLIASLSKEEMGGIFKKLGEIISMYEQPLDSIAHLDDDRFAFLLSRNEKKSALSEAEKIISSVRDSVFTSAQGALKITLSAGFILKVPTKSLEGSLVDAKKVTQRAKELGGNRIAQLHEIEEAFQ